MARLQGSLFSLLVASAVFAACGDSSNPFGDTGSSNADAGGGDAGAQDGGGTGNDGSVAGDGGVTAACDPIPARLVVLGDSIMACQGGVGGKDSPNCGIKALHTDLQGSVAPNLTYENNSVGGAVTHDVAAQQLQTVQGGPGHLLVVIYVGGNDLSPYIFVSDQQAQNGYNNDLPGLLADWQAIFTYFADTTKFPDGATLIMNTQYDPFDDCTAAPYNVSQVKFDLLHDFNSNLKTLADSNPAAHLTDQFTPFLGHGHHNTVMTCPYYMANAENWMADLIHPNAAGHANLKTEWEKITSALYVTCH